MHVFKSLEHYTAADYRQWQGDWELIEGAAYAMAPSPTVAHQALGLALARELDDALQACSRCRVLYEIDVQFAEDTVVRPDVVVVCHEPLGDWITRAPEMVVEIVSPKTARRDESIKFDLYEREGVRWYLLAYPESQTIKIWQWVDGRYQKAGDLHSERFGFALQDCTAEVDFGAVWRRWLR